MRVTRLLRGLVGIAVLLVACSDDDSSAPLPVELTCMATPVPPIFVAVPDPGESQYQCLDGWLIYSDSSCGPPTSPGCAMYGDGRCYKTCQTSYDCCGLDCATIPLFHGTDYSSESIKLCGAVWQP